MEEKQSASWFRLFSSILIFWGIFFAFFGLGLSPVKVQLLMTWQSVLYGSIMTGWGVTLFFVGRIAFKRNDVELMKAMLYGLFSWLLTEAFFSLYLGVWKNVLLDSIVLVVVGLPLVINIRVMDKDSIFSKAVPAIKLQTYDFFRRAFSLFQAENKKQ